MSNNSNSAKSSGLGVCSVLTIIFVVLKLVGVAPVAAWSWVWIFSPLWIGAALAFGLFVLFFVLAVIFSALGCNR